MYYKIISKISKPLSPEILHKLFLFSLKLRIFKKEKNFFETRVIEYQTGGALNW